MKVHEYQARELLRSAGVPVPQSEVIDNAHQAPQAYLRLGVESDLFAARPQRGGHGAIDPTRTPSTRFHAPAPGA